MDSDVLVKIKIHTVVYCKYNPIIIKKASTYYT